MTDLVRGAKSGPRAAKGFKGSIEGICFLGSSAKVEAASTDCRAARPKPIPKPPRKRRLSVEWIYSKLEIDMGLTDYAELNVGRM